MKELNKILSGKIIVKLRDQLIIVNQPDAQTRYLADSFAEQVYEEAFQENLFLQEELETLIIENGWWTQEEENLLIEIPKKIEQMKVEYFKNYIKTSVTERLGRAIKNEEDIFLDLQNKKYEFFNYTCESLQSQAYTMYILRACSEFESGEPVGNSSISMYSLYSKYNEELLNEKEIREVSKSVHWRMIWNSAKNGSSLFSFPACDLTSMQKVLINWARTYDSVYESPDMPSEDIIMDDYAIDGWFSIQRQKQEDQSKDSQKDQMPKTGEVFVMVKNKEEAKNVHEMNTQEAKSVIKSRERDLKNKGSLKEQEFSHVQTNLKMQANQLLSDHYKKKG